MTYLLDTNTIVRYLNGRAPNIRLRVVATPIAELAVSTISVAELRFGAAKSTNPARAITVQNQLLALVTILSFDVVAAQAYGPIRAALEKAGTPIGANDLLIAATAVANGLTLVTHNTREFSRVAGLPIEDWEQVT